MFVASLATILLFSLPTLFIYRKQRLLHFHSVHILEDEFIEPRVFPLTYIDVEPTKENTDVRRMRAVCRVYAQSYFAFNEMKDREKFTSPTLIGADDGSTPYSMLL